MLVPKGHWFECENRFARLLHRFNCFLETRRRCRRAEVAAGIYDNRYTCWNGCTTDAGDMRGRLSSSLADADCIGFATDTFTANVDIVAAGGEVITGLKAQCDVVVAGRVAKERLKTVRSVEEAACAVKERLRSGGRVREAD